MWLWSESFVMIAIIDVPLFFEYYPTYSTTQLLVRILIASKRGYKWSLLKLLLFSFARWFLTNTHLDNSWNTNPWNHRCLSHKICVTVELAHPPKKKQRPLLCGSLWISLQILGSEKVVSQQWGDCCVDMAAVQIRVPPPRKNSGKWITIWTCWHFHIFLGSNFGPNTPY